MSILDRLGIAGSASRQVLNFLLALGRLPFKELRENGDSFQQ